MDPLLGTSACSAVESLAARWLPGQVPPALRNGGEYELLAIISHMGANTMCGHYVCHVHKEGKWVLYNDRKVAASETPPLDLCYMYVYRRKD